MFIITHVSRASYLLRARICASDVSSTEVLSPSCGCQLWACRPADTGHSRLVLTRERQPAGSPQSGGRFITLLDFLLFNHILECKTARDDFHVHVCSGHSEWDKGTAGDDKISGALNQVLLHHLLCDSETENAHHYIILTKGLMLILWDL